MRKLIFVHGRAQEAKDPVQLKWTWIKALEEGLAKNGLKLPVAAEDIGFPFYGDRLDEVIADGGGEVITRGSPEDAAETEFKRSMLEEMRRGAGVSDAQIIELAGDDAIEKSPLNWPWVQGILRAFDRYVPGMSGTTVNLFTHDVYVYLRQPGVRDDIDRIVRLEIPTDQECVVVGHSLGSIVAFGILRRDEKLLKVPTFITVGSPLAIGMVRMSFEPLDCPRCVSSWLNARDPRDVVALYALDKSHFNVSCAIANKNDVNNFTANRHGIIGYLSDSEVAKTIYDALTR